MQVNAGRNPSALNGSRCRDKFRAGQVGNIQLGSAPPINIMPEVKGPKWMLTEEAKKRE